MTLRPPHDPTNFRTRVGRFRERWYVDPLPADENWPAWDAAVPAVSTVKNAWPKHLVPWTTRTCAEFAVDHADQWQHLDRQAAVDLIAGASNRSRDKAAARGTGVHHVLEQLAAGQEPMTALIPDVEPYLDACRRLVHDLEPVWVATEAVAINREPGWGGTLDAIISSPALGGTFLVDWKTRTAGKELGAHADEAVQLAAYAAADYLIVGDDDGARRVPVPDLDGAAVVAIGVDGYKVIPVDLEDALAIWEPLRAFWQAKTDLSPVGRPLHTHRAADRDPVEETAMLDERRIWLLDRVAKIKDAGKIDQLIRLWPDGVPGAKRAGEWTGADIDAVAAVLPRLEHDLPFHDGDPAVHDTLPQPRDMPEADESNRRVAPDDDRVTAFRARANSLPDDALAWLRSEWDGPRLNGGSITEAQLADFGVLLAKAEALAVDAENQGALL